MRKVKVAAASLCLLSYGMLHGGIVNAEVSVAKTDMSNDVIEMTAETVTTAASIETTSIVTTATTAKTTPAAKTTAAGTTATTAVSAPATTTAASTTVTEITSAAPVSSTATSTTEADQFLTAASVQEDTALSETAETTAQTETTASAEEDAEVTAAPENAITVTDREYCMLCNVVGHEYGANWVPESEKALVVEVIMNRVNSSAFPNSIYDVLMQRNQFAGLEYLVNLDGMSGYVTDSVKAAVDLYLSDPTQFNHGYLYFNGDGYRNYFRTRY